MKKLIFIVSTIFCTALVVISIYNMNTKPLTREAPPQQSQYIIADYHGKIAVFHKIDGEPVVVYEVYTHLLPENDIELLRKGIKVSSKEELQLRLEDFGL
ncbi:MAG: hypothetical protein RR846_06010 [Oscillospiraceae bacterium]